MIVCCDVLNVFGACRPSHHDRDLHHVPSQQGLQVNLLMNPRNVQSRGIKNVNFDIYFEIMHDLNAVIIKTRFRCNHTFTKICLKVWIWLILASKYQDSLRNVKNVAVMHYESTEICWIIEWNVNVKVVFRHTTFVNNFAWEITQFGIMPLKLLEEEKEQHPKNALQSRMVSCVGEWYFAFFFACLTSKPILDLVVHFAVW